MTIYIESFLIQNALINYCLLNLIKVSLKPQAHHARMIVSAIIGAIVSALGLCINNPAIGFAFKLLSPLILIFIAFKIKKKQIAYGVLLFYLYGFCFLGASVFVIKKFKISIEMIAIFAIIISYVFEKVVSKLGFKIKNGNFIYQIGLSLNKKQVYINAFLDSGNLLTYNGQPVVIVDLKTYLKLTGMDILSFYLSKGESINLHSMAGQKKLRVFMIDKISIKINGKVKWLDNQYIAVNDIAFKSTNYQALITPQMI